MDILRALRRSAASRSPALLRAAVVFYALYSVGFSLLFPLGASAQYFPQPGTPLPDGTKFFEPPKCTSGQGNLDADKRVGAYCPDITLDPNAQNTQQPYLCAQTYAEWVKNPNLNFWVEDPDVTALGKGGERSRQFLLWALTRQSIDDHPVILDTWRVSQNIALFLILIVVIMMGIGIIVGQQGIGFMGANFNFNVELTPLLIRVAMLLLYVVFSARIVLTFIQLSDVLMEFFIRTLGVRDLFNIFFIDTAGQVRGLADQLSKSEQAYREFIGCTNWNIANQEMVTTSKALVRFTNMTYYFIGGMVILRKVVLWFLIIVSPFLAILAPFVLIRNTGWIWIGVFFQWVFYGPLMALFLGGLARIWNSGPVHIPYIFDFSRVHKMDQMVYPTSINILYGGPAQKLGIFNTSNYVDTFAEYLISLIMLWTVLILPWWLLRIFRDYCCEGIYAMKNILKSMYDQMRVSNPPGGPSPVHPGPVPTGKAKLELDLPDRVKTPVEVKVKLETIQDIKQARTDQIARTFNISASTIRDVARMETNKTEYNTAIHNLTQVQNPFKADTATERQRLMNLRNEIQQRASRGDDLARRIAAVTSRSSIHEQVAKERIIQSMPQVSIPRSVSSSISTSAASASAAVSAAQQASVMQTTINYAVRNQEFVNTLSQQTHVAPPQSVSVMMAFTRYSTLDTSADELVAKIAQEEGMPEEEVRRLLEKAALLLKTRTDIVDAVARQEGVDRVTVSHVIGASLGEASGVTSAKTSQIVQRVLTQVSYDSNAVQLIARQSRVSEEQAQHILRSLSNNQTVSVSLKDAVLDTAAQTGVQPEQVRAVAAQAATVVGSHQELVRPAVQDFDVSTDTAQAVVKEKVDAVAKADKEIEDYVPQSPKVSIEDYEEVKSMWLQHYEDAEIPVTENVQTRQEWVEQDAVRISNILNKLLSPNRQMQEQGLNEVGYILPVFMVNNLSGEELLVYLKAKIQAAKEVGKSIRKEHEIRQQAHSQQEFVDIEAPKKHEAAKTQTLTASLELDNADDQTTDEVTRTRDAVKQGNMPVDVSEDGAFAQLASADDASSQAGSEVGGADRTAHRGAEDAGGSVGSETRGAMNEYDVNYVRHTHDAGQAAGSENFDVMTTTYDVPKVEAAQAPSEARYGNTKLQQAGVSASFSRGEPMRARNATDTEEGSTPEPLYSSQVVGDSEQQIQNTISSRQQDTTQAHGYDEHAGQPQPAVPVIVTEKGPQIEIDKRDDRVTRSVDQTADAVKQGNKPVDIEDTARVEDEYEIIEPELREKAVSSSSDSVTTQEADEDESHVSIPRVRKEDRKYDAGQAMNSPEHYEEKGRTDSSAEGSQMQLAAYTKENEGERTDDHIEHSIKDGVDHEAERSVDIPVAPKPQIDITAMQELEVPAPQQQEAKIVDLGEQQGNDLPVIPTAPEEKKTVIATKAPVIAEAIAATAPGSVSTSATLEVPVASGTSAALKVQAAQWEPAVPAIPAAPERRVEENNEGSNEAVQSVAQQVPTVPKPPKQAAPVNDQDTVLANIQRALEEEMH